MTSPDDTGTGHEASVPSHDLLLTVTDARGNIVHANEPVSVVTGFAFNELRGAPHSIIRHPQMPSGAFKLLWEQLNHGKPAAVYFMNKTRDARTYWVYSVIIGVGDQFISIGMRPSIDVFIEAAQSMYTEVRVIERNARMKGQSPDQVAQAGLSVIEETLRNGDFQTLDEYVMYTLPEEVKAYIARDFQLPIAPSEAGPTQEIWKACTTVDADTAVGSDNLDVYLSMAYDLVKAGTNCQKIIEELTDATAAAISSAATIKQKAPVLLNSAQVMGERAEAAKHKLTELEESLQHLLLGIRELRFVAALLQVQNLIVAKLNAEVISGYQQSETSIAIVTMTEALQSATTIMATDIEETAKETEAIVAVVEQAAEEAESFRRMLVKWRLLVPQMKVQDVLGEHIAPIDQRINDAQTAIATLRQQAHHFHSTKVPFNGSALTIQFTQMSDAAVQLQDVVAVGPPTV